MPLQISSGLRTFFYLCLLYIIGVIVQGYILYVYDSSVWFAIKTSAFYLILVMPVIYFYIKNANRNKKEFIRQFMVDQLTGLANRFAMIQEVRDKKPYALMLINLDSFREFNDFYGHKVGDSVLRQIALRLSGFIENGNSDMAHGVKLFKLHADEFGIVFKNRISREELEIISEMVLQHIASTPLVVDGHDVPMNATIGIACMDENVDANGGQYLMTASNVALRQAKNAKKPFMFYDNSMKIERRYEQNIIWIKKLKTAIANNKIVPYYQPILNNKSKKIEKYECLVRLVDEDGAVVSPHMFLDVAKKSRLYHKVTRSVVQKSFERFADEYCSFSINLSVLDICDEQMLEFIIEQLKKSNIGHRVVFEILESEGIDSYDNVYAFVEKIKSFGSKISIDDFGAGYSNFERILKLKPNFIKIDGSLIKNIHNDTDAQIIAKAIVGFANELGALTVAEFVHSKEVFDIVQALNIDYSQGYYICEPKPTI